MTQTPFAPPCLIFLPSLASNANGLPVFAPVLSAQKAISKDLETGVVQINEDRCTGCGECATACPYGAIGYNAEQTMPLNVTCAHIDALKATGLLAPLYAPQQLSNLVIEMTISRKQKQTAGMY